MIVSFGNEAARSAWERRFRKGLPNDVMKVAHRKLTQLNSAIDLTDLRVPPGNRLEALSGDRVGQYSIRVNEQWRLCFRWSDGQAFDVELVDYH